MIPLIVVAVIAGIILGRLLEGALKAALIVGVVVTALGFVGKHFDVDVRSLVGDGVKTARDAADEIVSEFQPGPPRLEKIDGERFRQQQGWM